MKPQTSAIASKSAAGPSATARQQRPDTPCSRGRPVRPTRSRDQSGHDAAERTRRDHGEARERGSAAARLARRDEDAAPRSTSRRAPTCGRGSRGSRGGRRGCEHARGWRTSKGAGGNVRTVRTKSGTSSAAGRQPSAAATSTSARRRRRQVQEVRQRRAERSAPIRKPIAEPRSCLEPRRDELHPGRIDAGQRRRSGIEGRSRRAAPDHRERPRSGSRRESR